MTKPANPFRYFDSSPEVIRLVGIRSWPRSAWKFAPLRSVAAAYVIAPVFAITAYWLLWIVVSDRL